MSRGRKAKNASINLEREQIYKKFQGFYFQFIISQLARRTASTLTKDDANELLEKITREKDALIREKKIKQGKLQEAELQSELIFDIPKNWVWCKLDDICFNITDGTHQTPSYTETGRPFISAQHVKPFSFTPYIYKHVSEEAYQECIKSGKPEVGDLLVTRVGAIGEAAVIDSDPEFAYYVSVGLVQPFKEHVYSKYIEFVINSPYGNLYSKGNVSSKGSSAGNFNLGRIRSFLIPFPPLREQQMILDFLNDFGNDNLKEGKVYFDVEIEGKVKSLFQNQLSGNLIADELAHQRTLVKTLRQQLLQEAVQGKLVKNGVYTEGVLESAHDLLKTIKAEKAQLIKDKKLKKEKDLPPIKAEEIPFEIPEGWVWCRLGEICMKITDGFHNTPPKVSEGFPYISATHVKPDNIDWEGCQYVAENFHRELFVKAYPTKGELLVVNIGAGCGTPAIIDVDYEFSFKNTAILKFNQEFIVNRLLYYYFLLRKDEIYLNLTKGGLQPFLSLKILNEIYFPLPPLAEQTRIVEKLDSLMQLCDNLDASIAASAVQNEQLLQQVLREALGG